jgi:hypothetical protein
MDSWTLLSPISLWSKNKYATLSYEVISLSRRALTQATHSFCSLWKVWIKKYRRSMSWHVASLHYISHQQLSSSSLCICHEPRIPSVLPALFWTELVEVACHSPPLTPSSTFNSNSILLSNYFTPTINGPRVRRMYSPGKANIQKQSAIRVREWEPLSKLDQNNQ